MNEKNIATLLLDIDGTICPQCEGNYDSLHPYSEAITTINNLYDEGYKIVFYTSRFMGRCENNVIEAYKEGYEFTLQQLKSWGVKFHELHMGKPRSDIVIDDRAIFFENNWEKIKEEIRKKFKVKNGNF